MEPIIETFAFPALISALAVAMYQYLTFRVGQARGKYGVQPPAMAGHPDFERALRVQQNMLEQLAAFLTSLWLFAIFLNRPMAAAALGAVWLLGRALYARGYYQASAKRLPGFVIALFASSLLLLGGIVGILLHMVAMVAK